MEIDFCAGRISHLNMRIVNFLMLQFAEVLCLLFNCLSARAVGALKCRLEDFACQSRL